MWVNISDSLLSVFLVWTLIPRMGIMGYALVIVIMEGYNFLLSFIRLRKRVSFRIRPIDSIVIPLSASAVGIMITVGAFHSLGSSSTLFLILLKLVFALAITVAAYNLFLIANSLLQNRRKKKDSKQPKAA
jgi:O-antigen/teichoic acid export membrane protein